MFMRDTLRILGLNYILIGLKQCFQLTHKARCLVLYSPQFPLLHHCFSSLRFLLFLLALVLVMILQRNHGYRYRQVCFEELAYVIGEANSSEMYRSGRPAA